MALMTSGHSWRLQCLLTKLTSLTSARLVSSAVRVSSNDACHPWSTAGRHGIRLTQRRQFSLHPALSATTSAAPVGEMKADKPLAAEGRIHSFEVNTAGNILTVTWRDGQVSNFHSLWLRHSCHCKDCMDENSGQLMYLSENLDPEVTVQSVGKEGDNLVIEFGGKEPHRGHVPIKFLKHYDYSQEALRRKKAAVDITTYATKVPKITYQDVVQTEDGLYRWLKKLTDYGFCVVKGVPSEHRMVVKMAEMIGPVQQTIYDQVFDVKVSEQQLTNKAFSADGLVFHQDMTYYESPPGLQFLHTLRFDECVSGGESLIVDVFRVAQEFRQSHPDHFEALATILATFQKIHYGRALPIHITITRPVFVLNHDDKIVGVNWMPLHEGPTEVPEHQVEPYYKARIAFAKAIKNAPVQFQFRMEDGDLLVFNNRRMCHARNGFALNGGVRHLRGLYMNAEHFKSRFMVLTQKFGNGRPCQRIGNQCMF